jgi:ribosome-interacting GTPase 1
MDKEQLIAMGVATQFKSGKEAALNGAKGGIKSGESKRRTKLFNELIKNILEKPATAEMTQTLKDSFGVQGQELTLKEAMVYAQTLKAISKQDTQAFTALVDRVDGKPVQESQLSGPEGGEINISVLQDELRKKADEMRSDDDS